MQLVLLSGGSGKRLWPLSNNSRSKQFLQLLEAPDGSKESMVQRVVRQAREAGLCPDITFATNESQLEYITAQLGPEVSAVTEPERRDTFPAIALAASWLALGKGCADDETVVVMPCDAYTENAYFETIAAMVKAVQADAAELVLMGIRPTYPSSKFGYVVPQAGVKLGDNILKVARFTEKPTTEVAQELLAQGAMWNGGVFAFRLGYMMDIARKYVSAPTFEQVRARYCEFPKISFDYEVAEKAASVAVVPFSGAWKDLGTWNALTEELPRPVLGNGVMGEACRGSFIVNELPIPILVEGLDDVVVAASADGILVCKRSDTENIKKYVENIGK